MSTETITVISNEPKPAPAAEKEVASPVADSADAEDDAESTDASGASENEQEEEGKEAEDTKEGDEEVEAKAQPKKKGGFQKRIDKLTAKNAELERRLNELAAKDPQKHAEKVEQQQEAASGEPQEGDYETHAEYIRAIVKWENAEHEKQKAEESRKKSVQDEHQTRVSKFGQEFNEFAKVHTDARDVINEAFEEKPMSIAVQELLLDSENGQELSYELAKNLEEWTRINSLPPMAAARELGKFEASLSKPEPKTNPKKLTKAPEPITPVGGKGRVTTEKSIYDATDEMSQAEFERLEALSRKKRA